jgi:hypothetical protein
MVKQKEIKQTASEVVEEKKPVVTQEQLDAIIKSNEELKSKIERLEYAANKAQIAKWNDQHRETKLREVKVIRYHDKYVVGWGRMLENRCEKVDGVWEESLKTEIIFEDDTKEVVDYEIFQRNYKYVVGSVLSEIKDSKGNTVYEIQLPEGKVLNINTIFLN